jgi:hypothetical protein
MMHRTRLVNLSIASCTQLSALECIKLNAYTIYTESVVDAYEEGSWAVDHENKAT